MSEILEIPSSAIKKYLSENSNAVLIDVRTKEEWDIVGMPDGESLGLPTFFISYQIGKERVLNINFIEEFKDLDIDKTKKILFICRSGARSLSTAKMINELGYETVNILGGFEGSAVINDAGWKGNGLPCK